jgi:hypothetical protein
MPYLSEIYTSASSPHSDSIPSGKRRSDDASNNGGEVSGIINLVAQVDSGKFKTIKQVAEIIGRDPSTIRAAVRNGKVEGATHKMLLGDGSGKSFVWLYTDEDIERFKKHFVRVPIRPRKRTTAA